MKQEKQAELLFFFSGLVGHYKKTHEIGPGFDDQVKIIFRLLEAAGKGDKHDLVYLARWADFYNAHFGLWLSDDDEAYERIRALIEGLSNVKLRPDPSIKAPDPVVINEGWGGADKKVARARRKGK